MPDRPPLDYESTLNDATRTLPPRASPRRRPPAHAHAIACVLCLVLFWGNAWMFVGDPDPYLGREPLYDLVRMLWTVVGGIGVAYGVLAGRFTDGRRRVGRWAAVLCGVIVAAMWIWRSGALAIFWFRT